MKQLFLSTSVILLIIGMMFASFGSTSFTVRAESSNSAWQLSINGLVSHPANFTITDLEAMPQTTVSAAIFCVDSPTLVVTQGNWQGVKLWTLLNESGVSPGAIKVAFYAKDGYSTDLTIDLAKNDDVIVAYAKDGVPLNEILRLVVPGHWGYKWISQLIELKLVNNDFKGKWETFGYSDDATITQTNVPNSPPAFPTPSLQTPLPASPSASPSIPPIINSTSQPTSSLMSKNLTSQNFNVLETVAIISIAIAAIVLTITIKKKKPRYRSNNPNFSADNSNQT
jgi:hypothetical protein